MDKKAIITSARLRLQQAERAFSHRKIRQIMRKRRLTQPIGARSAGCIFKNPGDGVSAGALIEKSGLKGLRIGDACVSRKHANFIVNSGGARAKDVLALIQRVRERVFRDHGIELEPEVKVLGRCL